MEAYRLPYYAEPATIPARLPTLDEIDASQEILSGQSARKVVGIGDHFVVKYGMGVDLLEGETMLFLQRSTSVPVPRVYALFRNPDTKNNYIIMERIQGSSLDSEWPKMDQAAKEAVASTLRSHFAKMRTLVSPGGYCSFGRRGLPDGIFWTSDPSNPFAGPFDTESDLNEAMVAKYTESGISKYKAEFYSRAFKVLLKDHPPIFSHGDLQRKNVIIRCPPALPPEEKQSKQPQPEIVIIDWEYAGWYPSYWEYARAIFACGRWSDDWSLWVDKFVEPALSEYAWMSMLLRELWS
jgi:hypothetical protein